MIGTYLERTPSYMRAYQRSCISFNVNLHENLMPWKTAVKSQVWRLTTNVQVLCHHGYLDIEVLQSSTSYYFVVLYIVLSQMYKFSVTLTLKFYNHQLPIILWYYT